jgi:hypothetical protein
MKAPLALVLCFCGAMALAQENPCLLLPDPGECEAAIPAWYFDQDFQTCAQFTWGGCGGVVPFETLEDCEAAACGEGEWELVGLCDSIAVAPVVIGDAALGHLEVEVNADYQTTHWFGYAGFALFDAAGTMVAAENVSTAPNAFGFDGQLGPHNRYLDYVSGNDLSTWASPFILELRLYEGWMAGSPTERCAWTWTEWSGLTGVIDPPPPSGAFKEDPMWFDILGRPTTPSLGRVILRRENGRVKRMLITE